MPNDTEPPRADAPLLLTIPEVADTCGVSVVKIWRLVRAGILPTVNVPPRSTRIPRAAVLQAIATNFAPPQEATARRRTRVA